MVLDVVRARSETPGCERVLHFNNAGAALMPRPVLDTARDYLTLEAEIGGYEAAEREDAAIERFYSAAAELLGCDVDEIAVVENAFAPMPGASKTGRPTTPARSGSAPPSTTRATGIWPPSGIACDRLRTGCARRWRRLPG